MLGPVDSEERKDTSAMVQPQEAKAAAEEAEPAKEEVDEEDAPEILRCEKIKECGHQCNGVWQEKECLTCLDPSCHLESSRLPNNDELCSICFTSELGEEACVQLGCLHVFHANCVLKLLRHRWSTLKISFGFTACPSCKQEITEHRCHQIVKEIAIIKKIRSSVEEIAIEAADDISALPMYASRKEKIDLAMQLCAFFECYDCGKPYYGGMIDC